MPPPDDRTGSSGKPEDNGSPLLPFRSLTKDLDDCDRPACADTVSALSAALGRVRKNRIADSPKLRDVKQCPPTSSELGASSWTLLHSMASDAQASERVCSGILKDQCKGALYNIDHTRTSIVHSTDSFSTSLFAIQNNTNFCSRQHGILIFQHLKIDDRCKGLCQQ